MEGAFLKIALVGAALLLSIGYSYWNPQAKKDNPIEEVAEEIIKQQTGIDVDLSPDSPEKD